MAKISYSERYKANVVSAGVRYKFLAHQVVEDESLFVELRNPPRPTRAASGMAVGSSDGLRIDASGDSDEDNRAHSLHYHPSGHVNVKRFDGTKIRTLSFPPLIALKQPLFLLGLSVANVSQLNVDPKAKDPADIDFDLDAFPVNRPQGQIWIGPKGAFSPANDGPFSPHLKAVYSDAAIYDVAYFLGPGPLIDPNASYGGKLLSDMVITQSPLTDVPHDSPFAAGHRPEFWSTPHAVARQFRAHLEHLQTEVRQALGGADGHVEIKISLCSDGVICSLDWHPFIQDPRFSWNVPNLSTADVLNILMGQTHALQDVHEIAPEIVSGPNSVFVRVGSKSNLSNALVFLASELLPNRYYRIPRDNIRNIEQYLRLACLAGKE